MSAAPKFHVAADLLGQWRDSLHGPPPTLWPVGTDALATVETGPGRIVLVGGAPGSGKTALVMQFVIDALRLTPDLRAVVANVEMSPSVLLDRQLARLSGVPLDVIAKRRLGSEHEARVDRGLATLESVADRLAFVTEPHDLAAAAEAVDGFDGGLLVLDYAQRIRPPGEHADKRSSVNALMDYLRRFADAGVGVLAVAAVGRVKDKHGRQSYDGRGLGLASFRESSELEFGADAAYLLLPSVDDPQAVILRCVKHRHGEPVDVPLRFERRIQSFVPLAAEPSSTSFRDSLRRLWALTPPPEEDDE